MFFIGLACLTINIWLRYSFYSASWLWKLDGHCRSRGRSHVCESTPPACPGSERPRGEEELQEDMSGVLLSGGSNLLWPADNESRHARSYDELADRSGDGASGAAPPAVLNSTHTRSSLRHRMIFVESGSLSAQGGRFVAESSSAKGGGGGDHRSNGGGEKVSGGGKGPNTSTSSSAAFSSWVGD